MPTRRNHPCEHCKRVRYYQEPITKNAPSSCAVSNIRKNQVLFDEGAKPKDVYLLKYGSLRFFKTWEDGERQIVRIVFPGELIGYPALLTEEPYSVTAEAREDSAVCVWNGTHFLKQVSTDPQLAVKMNRLLARDLRQARKALLNRSILSAERRLAQFLLDLSMVHRSGMSDLRWASIPRNEAAEVTGAKPETVSRILHAWKRDGLVSLNGKQVLIKNMSGLKSRLSDHGNGNGNGNGNGSKKADPVLDPVWSVLS